MKAITQILCLFLLFSSISAQRLEKYGIPVIPNREIIQKDSKSTFNYIPKKPGHYTKSDWDAVIDSTWGPGLPLNQKLAIFDEAWNNIDAEFAAFQGLNVDWDALKLKYRPEVAAGVSRGRFHAIMSYMMLALQEFHTFITDAPVYTTHLEPGVPLLDLSGNADNTSRFGATLTPLPDSSLLVLKTVLNHPIGLQPGDIILGYDGVQWKDLIKELISYELPIRWGNSIPGADPKSNRHNLLCSAGMNWHLFDSLDVVKYSTGDTMSYATSLLAGQNEFIFGNEQLPVPGVDWVYTGSSNIDANEFENNISWGIIDDTNIGYIYAVAWGPDYLISTPFYTAINEMMNVNKVDGLIIDERLNYGGGWAYQYGLTLLFNHTFKPYDFRERCNAEDHFEMCENDRWDSYLTTRGGPNTFFDRPIAVLTGPAALSCGDMFPVRMGYHPMVRSFGKPTNGSFSNDSGILNPGNNDDWIMYHTTSNGYLLADPDNYLSHRAFVPDEEVWFTQEDVVKGEDTVVKRALEWIENLVYAHDVSVDKIHLKPGVDSVLISAKVENPNQHQVSILTRLHDLDGTFIDSLLLYDDGAHGDGSANDSLWGNYYRPVNEQSFNVSVTTKDVSDQTSRSLPNVAWFTTFGPVTIAGEPFVEGDYSARYRAQYLQIRLENKGATGAATNLSLELHTDDIRVARLAESVNVEDIAAGAEGLSSLTSFNYSDGYNPDSTINHPIHFEVILSFRGTPCWETSFDFEHTDTTGIPYSDHLIPVRTQLYQNYPNPFNNRTIINYQLPTASNVELSIYNILGQKVATLVSKKQAAGHHQVEWDASGFSSGVYLYNMHTDRGFSQTKKLVLLK